MNFTDVADLDDEALENHVREDLVGRLVEGDFFKLCMLFIVFLSAVVVAVETYEELVRFSVVTVHRLIESYSM